MDGYRIDGVVVGSYRTVRRRPVILVPVWAPWHELAPKEEEAAKAAATD